MLPRCDTGFSRASVDLRRNSTRMHRTLLNGGINECKSSHSLTHWLIMTSQIMTTLQTGLFFWLCSPPYVVHPSLRRVRVLYPCLNAVWYGWTLWTVYNVFLGRFYQHSDCREARTQRWYVIIIGSGPISIIISSVWWKIYPNLGRYNLIVISSGL